MSTLKYAILGVLSRSSMTGYDMAKEFETSLFEFWNAKHSQIYPELKNLTAEGLVAYDIEISGNVLEKKLYSITEKGRQEFRKWELTYHKLQTASRDEFRLQMYFAYTLSPGERLALMEARLAEHRQKLEHLKKKETQFSSVPPKQEEELMDYMVWLGAVIREEGNCSWLETCIRCCGET